MHQSAYIEGEFYVDREPSILTNCNDSPLSSRATSEDLYFQKEELGLYTVYTPVLLEDATSVCISYQDMAMEIHELLHGSNVEGNYEHHRHPGMEHLDCRSRSILHVDKIKEEIDKGNEVELPTSVAGYYPCPDAYTRFSAASIRININVERTVVKFVKLKGKRRLEELTDEEREEHYRKRREKHNEVLKENKKKGPSRLTQKKKELVQYVNTRMKYHIWVQFDEKSMKNTARCVECFIKLGYTNSIEEFIKYLTDDEIKKPLNSWYQKIKQKAIANP